MKLMHEVEVVESDELLEREYLKRFEKGGSMLVKIGISDASDG
jgi:hypothetical protein